MEPDTERYVVVDEVKHEIVYKGYKLWVTKKKNGGTQGQNENYYSNNIRDLLGVMNSNPCIEISMRGQDLKLLQSLIQEWIDMHYERQNGKVT